MTGTEHVEAHGIEMMVTTEANGITLMSVVRGAGAGWVYAVFYGMAARADALEFAEVAAGRIAAARAR